MSGKTSAIDTAILLGARLFASAVFIVGGLGLMSSNHTELKSLMESVGVPGFLLWPTIIFELVAGVCMLVGYKVKPVAFLLAGFCLVTGALFHFAPDDPEQMRSFFKNVGMAGGFLAFVRFGAGNLSLDNRGKE